MSEGVGWLLLGLLLCWTLLLLELAPGHLLPPPPPLLLLLGQQGGRVDRQQAGQQAIVAHQEQFFEYIN